MIPADDARAIEGVIVAYLFALDAVAPVEDVLSSFTSDAVWESINHGQTEPLIRMQSHEQIAMLLAFERQTPLAALMRHHPSATRLRLDDGTVVSETRVLVTTQAPGQPPALRNVATCRGRWRRVDGAWKIAHWTVLRDPVVVQEPETRPAAPEAAEPPRLAFETERLRVRPFRLDDLDACHAALDGEPGGESRAERERWLAWSVQSHRQLARLRQPPYGDYAIELRDEGASGVVAGSRVIGACGLVPCLAPFGLLPSWRARSASGAASSAYVAEVGLYYELAPSHRGRGLATEAVEGLLAWCRDRLVLERIVATTRHDNARSIRMMERLGMVIERNPLPDPPWFQVVGTRTLRGSAS